MGQLVAGLTLLLVVGTAPFAMALLIEGLFLVMKLPQIAGYELVVVHFLG